MSELIRIEPLEPGIVSVMLNRPERRNALSIALLEQLVAAVRLLEQDASHRVIILQAAGPIFSAGLDLREAADASCVERSAAAVQEALDRVRRTSLVVVAAVQGGAYAGGAGLVAACDVVVAADDAKFGFPEARRGLLPALILDVLAAKVRDGDLRDLFLTGDPVDAHRAQIVGLVQRLVPPDDLLEESLRVGRSILAGGPETIRLTKALLETRRSPSGAKDLIRSHLAARQSDEAREGLQAFAERREPDWS